MAVSREACTAVACRGEAEAQNARPLLEVRHVRKRFAEASGLIAADLQVRRGEVHALIGANGSGKSTLMKVVAGVYQRDSGEILFDGAPVRFSSPRAALERGIVAMHQELHLVPHLSAADNIFLGDETLHHRLPILRRHEMQQRTAALLSDLGAAIDPASPIETLSMAQQQLVSIAKALHRRVELFILDEPTAALGAAETERLFALITRLCARDVAVIYVSHRLDEVLEIAQRITVLRAGRTVGTFETAQTSRDALIRHMVGGEIDKNARLIGHRPGTLEALRVEGLTRRGVFENITFRVAAGEIYGLAGIAGSGRTEVARAIFGADPLDGGRILLYGRELRIRSPRDALHAGIGLVPEDRKADGLVLCQSGRENVALTIWEKIARWELVTPHLGMRLAAGFIAQLGIHAPAPGRPVHNLSGGDQQKIVLAKWLATLPKVLIFDEPTRGIDAATKPEICALIRRAAAQGLAVIVISSELAELLSLADRVGVLRHGRLVAEFERGEATQEAVLRHALGGETMARPAIVPPVRGETRIGAGMAHGATL